MTTSTGDKKIDSYPTENTTQVLDKGFVRLDDSMASDLKVVNSARVSLRKYKWIMDMSDEKLIGFLMKRGEDKPVHTSPFEHSVFTFHVKCPIFIARQWFRHRWASYNEMSGRYVEMEDEFYMPAPENIRTQVGKPGAYTFEPIREEDQEYDKYNGGKTKFILACMDLANTMAFSMYEKMLQVGVARELARIILPLGTYTQFYWTVNANSLMHFISLRNHKEAQYEIRQYAMAVEDYFKQKMPVTYRYFNEYGREAP